jgi:P-type E1-E2 ATPase
MQEGISIQEPDDFSYELGRGVRAAIDGRQAMVGSAAMMKSCGLQPQTSGTGEIFVSHGDLLLGSIVVSDRVRPEAKSAVQDLYSMGINPMLLTGDAKTTASSVARDLGIREVYAELLPQEKRERVKKEVQQKKTVAMVGDGINDAPALVEANIGIAMGSGTDVARESADVVLIGNDLSRFVATLRIARKCRSVIMQNFYGTLLVDAAGIVLAALGFLHPLLAAFIHVSSELAFILNSTRMLPRGSTPSSNA